MTAQSKVSRRSAGPAGWLLVLACSMLLAGCAPLGYLAQSVGGHLQLVAAARPVPDWLADDATPPALRDRLLLSQRIRDFAVSELKLPDNASYRRYADIGRRAAVWNVVAAPELSLRLKTWCYPVVGCVGYRGYYDRADADRAVAPLRDEGLDVLVYAVPAYSTLGKIPGEYFADPLLNTFIHYPEGQLAGLIFHELSHQVVYLAGDTGFNESFATAVERIGARRWLSQRGSEAARQEYERQQSRQQDFRELTRQTRRELEAVYDGDGSAQDKRAARDRVMASMRERYRLLKEQRWDGFSGYDGWIAAANNASLGLIAAYNSKVPEFEAIFERSGSNFDAFYAEVKRISRLPDAERKALFAAESN
ncbi:aminopeptidase [Piscinibacter sakaiensis]|uniref:aminopeptidase n=1 Tax=Piscinibacter sakaiensis TaxID=1547922 RepID=UPI003AAFAB2A